MTQTVQIPPELREEYPFESHFLTTEQGHSMHYIDTGEGRPFLFVHGNPTWSFFFPAAVFSFLKQRHASYSQ